MTKIEQLAEIGQSVWLDFIRRNYIKKGELQKLIDDGLRGITSNPAIFEKAIANHGDYDNQIREIMNDEYSVEEVFEKLAVRDIDMATDAMMPVYEKTNGTDGFVSLEVSPKLAADTAGTIADGKRLFDTLGKPNVMIKVPATQEGLPAITELIGMGVNVNVTLIFSLENYRQVVESYIAGLEKYAETHDDLSKIASVASFFVSRVDTQVDKQLDPMKNLNLMGKIAIANAKVATEIASEMFGSERWKKLEAKGAQKQRLLWASTGTKNPRYSDVLYIDNLIGPNTVNTIPPSTLESFIDHGVVENTLETKIETAHIQLNELKELGIDLDKITDELQVQGVKLFADAFDSLLHSLENKIEKLKHSGELFKLHLQNYEPDVMSYLSKMREEKIVDRIWKKDHTVWRDEPSEIANRLGWLESPENTMKALGEINAFVKDVLDDGFKHALLLGMGGSSLAPEVFSKIFGSAEGHLDLAVLDSTDPGAVLAYAEKLDPAETLYIVSTKSGGTVETLSFMKYFYKLTADKLGVEKAGRHFAAITDPGSGLETLARSFNFRKIFLNDPDIGGRYSALSFFGTVPAGLIGVDLAKLLNAAGVMACNSEGENCPLYGDNTSAKLGAVLGVLAGKNVNKLTLITSDTLAPFGAWVEQLIAESTGKDGKGILPVDLEKLLEPEAYSNDRLFVSLKLKNEAANDEQIIKLVAAGFPVVEIILDDVYELGGEFFRWEMATAIAGWILDIQPFDQPNVESAKILGRKMVKEYLETGKLPELEPDISTDEFEVFAEGGAEDFNTLVKNFFGKLSVEDNSPRGYVCIQAYVTPNEETDSKFAELRTAIQKKMKCATTFGYGPRFLHSTGQLHKGDAGKGLFLQFSSAIIEDADIPDEPGGETSTMSFGVLREAQALGDRAALLENARAVLRFKFKSSIEAGIQKLIEALN